MEPKERIKFINKMVAAIAEHRPEKADENEVAEAVFMAVQLTSNMYTFKYCVDCYARRRD